MERYADHYKFDAAAREAAEKSLAQIEAQADNEFRNPDFVDKIADYRNKLARIDRILNSPLLAQV